ncbi:MAG: FtsX-like permease family protein [Luteitalea sp.]|nr:FtsX-like permease family protein [Luteitalea sp.]
MAEWLNSVGLRVRALFRRGRLNQDLHDEIAHHLAMREAKLRASGTAQPAAHARRQFGSVATIQEELRESWTFAPHLGNVLQDLRYAARMLRHSAGFAVAVVLTLGLGIGANTAFFSIVNAALIRPLGYADADRLVAVHESFPESNLEHLPFSPLDFEDLQRYQEAFDGVAAYRSIPFELSGHGLSEQVQGARVSASLLPTLGVAPIVGRTFSTKEDRPGVHVAILSWGLWHRRYGADPAIVGRRITLDRRAYTVVGVMPRTFVFPRRGPRVNHEPADVWVPLAFTDRERVERAMNLTNSVVARLKSGVSLEMAQAQLDVLSGQIAANYPSVVLNAGFRPHLSAVPLREDISGRFRFPLLMLLAAGGFVLLVACANVANLMLSRAAGRNRELAVRAALGAGRGRLMQLLLCEALLLSFAGGALGVTLAYWSVETIPAVLASSVPGLQDVTLDLRVLAFTAMTCVATGLIVGLLPLATLDRRSPGDALRADTSRTTGARQRPRMQQAFVISAVGLAFVLLVGAGLLLRSFSALIATNPGFRAAQVLTVSMTLPQTTYNTPASVRTFHRALLGGLGSVPGVRYSSLASDFPLGAVGNLRFEPEGSALASRVTPMTNLTSVQGPYFETFGMTLRHGRFFTEEEHLEDRRVVIVNEKLATRFWPGENPIGKRLKWGSVDSVSPWLTVVGVVGDVADGPIGVEPDVHAYQPFRQAPDFFLDRRVKTAVLVQGNARALSARIREEIARLDPQLAIESIAPMEQRLRDAFAPRRFSTGLVMVCAAVALLLAWIGLYGLLAFSITERRREIAVRLALGAEPRAVAGMVVAQAARLVAVGLIVGFVASLGVTRLVTSLLYETNHYDAMTFVIVPLVVALAALLACAVPAWRAASVEPLKALRAE